MTYAAFQNLINVPIFSDYSNIADATAKFSRNGNHMSFKNHLSEWMGGLSAKEAKVLSMRFSLDNHSAHTLEEVGRQFDVTRERIRQMEHKAIQKFLQGPASLPLIEAYEALKGAPFLLNDIFKHNVWDKTLEDTEAFVFAALKSHDPGLRRVQALDSWLVGGDQISNFEPLKSRLVREFFQYRLPDIDAQILKKIPPNFDLSKNLVVRAVLFDIKSIIEDPTRDITPSTRKLLLNILESSEKSSWSIRALKFEFQQRHPNLNAPKENSISNVLNENCVQIGRGKYALPGTLAPAPESLSLIFSIVDRLLGEKAINRQWHAAEVAIYMEERGLHAHIPFGEYSIYQAVKSCPNKFLSLGRLVFMLQSEAAPDERRLEVHELAVEILREAKRPMKIKWVMNKVREKRGLGRNPQLHYDTPITTNGFGELYLTDYSF